MVSFKSKEFTSKEEQSLYINARKNEFIPYDYNFEKEILPVINNLIPTAKKVRVPRELKNVRVFLRETLVNIMFTDFDFGDITSAGLMYGAMLSDFVSAIYFVHCRFGVVDGVDIPEAGAYYYDCVFDERYTIRTKAELPSAPVEFNNCVFNAPLGINGLYNAVGIGIYRCLFNEKANFSLENYNSSGEQSLYYVAIHDTIFKGEVCFDKANLPFGSNFKYLSFFNNVSFKNTTFAKNVTLQELNFMPPVTKTAKEGLKSLITALNKSGYTSEAKFYEQNTGIDASANTINQDEFNIALQSNWLNIKQAAIFLGLSYETLVTMRKEDKAQGIMRIPFNGSGKSSRYYRPLLEAYKSGDMRKVNELAREMEKKE